jgi:hypothetical protein
LRVGCGSRVDDLAEARAQRLVLRAEDDQQGARGAQASAAPGRALIFRGRLDRLKRPLYPRRRLHGVFPLPDLPETREQEGAVVPAE